MEMIRRSRLTMDASNKRKCCRMALLLILLPVTIAMEESVIQMAQSGELLENGKPRFIITARALEEEAVSTSEPDDDVEEEEVSTEYDQVSTEETEASSSSSESAAVNLTSTESGIFTSTAGPIYTTEHSSTASLNATTPSAVQDEPIAVAVENDLSASATNLDAVLHRRTDASSTTAAAATDHPVVYARLKHPPVRPSTPETVDPSVGSIFGRPYNARPFSSRISTTERTGSEQQLFPTFPLATPEEIGDLPDQSLWTAAGNGKSSNRWEKEKAANQRLNMTRVQSVAAECQNDYMKVRIRFNGSFSGIIYSTGFAYDPLCVYINGTGRDYYEFYIQLNRCGTLGGNTHNLDSRKQPTKNFMWNTLSIQYSPLIEEEWDEHYKMTCEYGYDYWKTVTFPFLDIEVATGNPLSFTLTPPESHMEIRSGYGTTGNRVTGPVRVGDPLTLIIYMRSQFDGFDLIASNCYAHNGANKKIQLIDNNGCPINEKLISRFRGTWTDAGLYETQVFAYMKAFRFTGSPALYIECDVRMCHGHCPIQPCYWRNSRDIAKRDVGSSRAPLNRTLSENLSLFQSLQVIADDEVIPTDDMNDGLSSSDRLNSTNRNSNNPDHICLKPAAVGAFFGLSSLITLALGIISCVLLARLRRRSQSDSAIYSHPYAHTSIIDTYAKQRNNY